MKGRGKVECGFLLWVVSDVEVSFDIFVVIICGAEGGEDPAAEGGGSVGFFCESCVT